MKFDQIIECPRCSSDTCYETQVTPELKNYACMGCGFISNSLMKEGEEFWEAQFEKLPELYKDLIHVDHQGKHWIPNVTNIPEKGMVFVEGVNENDWGWTAVKSVKITKKERKNYPVKGQPGKFHESRMDMTNKQIFLPVDYIEALDYIGMFNK